ncbi:MAG TPA: nucleoside hydrolase [Clostridia bacterium]|nr:nucleoside hydrolase [Clostridia bacterium]
MLTTAQRLAMLECPKGKVDMVLDTDAYNEIDDQFAISYALRAKEKLNLLALYAAPFLNGRSTSPLDGMEKSYEEILKLLKLAQENTPVFKGSGGYLPDEKTPVDSPAARDLAERAMAYSSEKPLYVVAIGAITNVASAMLMRPEIADRVVVVWLGGHSVEWPDTKEFNMMQDVAAARVVFGSGAPVVMLPCMGVVSAFTTTGPELTHWLKGKTALSDYLAEQTIAEANTYAAGRVWSRVIWDVTAVAWLLNDSGKLLKDRLMATPIPEYDHHYGFDNRRALCKYVYHVGRDALFGDLFEKVIR